MSPVSENGREAETVSALVSSEGGDAETDQDDFCGSNNYPVIYKKEK